MTTQELKNRLSQSPSLYVDSYSLQWNKVPDIIQTLNSKQTDVVYVLYELLNKVEELEREKEALRLLKQ